MTEKAEWVDELYGVEHARDALEKLTDETEIEAIVEELEDHEEPLANARKVRANKRTTLIENITRYKLSRQERADAIAKLEEVGEDDPTLPAAISKIENKLSRQVAKAITYANWVAAADIVIERHKPEGPTPVAPPEASEEREVILEDVEDVEDVEG